MVLFRGYKMCHKFETHKNSSAGGAGRTHGEPTQCSEIIEKIAML